MLIIPLPKHGYFSENLKIMEILTFDLEIRLILIYVGFANVWTLPTILLEA